VGRAVEVHLGGPPEQRRAIRRELHWIAGAPHSSAVDPELDHLVESARRGFLLRPVSLDSEKLQVYGTAGAATGKQPTPLRGDRCSVRPAQTPSRAVAAS